MYPLMARMKFIQDEVGEKEVILSLLWEINSSSKSFLIIYFNISWQKDKTAHRTSKILMQQDSPDSQVRLRNLNAVGSYGYLACCFYQTVSHGH